MICVLTSVLFYWGLMVSVFCFDMGHVGKLGSRRNWHLHCSINFCKDLQLSTKTISSKKGRMLFLTRFLAFQMNDNASQTRRYDEFGKIGVNLKSKMSVRMALPFFEDVIFFYVTLIVWEEGPWMEFFEEDLPWMEFVE